MRISIKRPSANDTHEDNDSDRNYRGGVLQCICAGSVTHGGIRRHNKFNGIQAESIFEAGGRPLTGGPGGGVSSPLKGCIGGGLFAFPSGGPVPQKAGG